MCRLHGHREAARPPGEPAATQRRANDVASTLEPIHAAIIAGLLGSTVSGAAMPLASLPEIRRAVATRFATRQDPFADAIQQTVYEGAELGRATAVRRYGLSVSPTFGDAVGGSVADLPTGDPTRTDLNRIARRARSEVTPRMVRDISQAIYEAREAGLSREAIAERLRTNTFESARSLESRRLAETELSAGVNRGALAAYAAADDTDEKRWQAQLDTNTRQTHRDASGDVVPLNEDFRVGGFRASYPGDPRLPPGERVRCRCWVLPR